MNFFYKRKNEVKKKKKKKKMFFFYIYIYKECDSCKIKYQFFSFSSLISDKLFTILISFEII